MGKQNGASFVVGMAMVTILIMMLMALSSCYTARLTDSNMVGLATGAPHPNIYPSAQPGETRPLPRMYLGAPPVIPHDISEFQITRSSNDCLGCHIKGAEIEDGHVATKIPLSHFAEPGKKAGHSKAVIADMRYNCRQCHVPQAL